MKEKFNLSLTTEEKEQIQSKALQYGYRVIAKYIVDCCLNNALIKINTDGLKSLSKEISVVGRNINQIVRNVNMNNSIDDDIIKNIESNQKLIVKLLQKKYNDVFKIYDEFQDEGNSKELLKRIYKYNNIEVPKRYIIENEMNAIKRDVMIIISFIDSNDFFTDEYSQNLYNIVYDEKLNLNDKQIVEVSNFIFDIKNKIEDSKEITQSDYFEIVDFMKKYIEVE